MLYSVRWSRKIWETSMFLKCVASKSCGRGDRLDFITLKSAPDDMSAVSKKLHKLTTNHRQPDVSQMKNMQM